MRRARAWTSSAPQAQPIMASARSTALRCAVIRCPALSRRRSRPSSRRSAFDPSRTMGRPPNENDFHYLSALLYGAHPLHVKGTRSLSCIRLRSKTIPGGGGSGFPLALAAPSAPDRLAGLTPPCLRPVCHNLRAHGLPPGCRLRSCARRNPLAAAASRADFHDSNPGGAGGGAAERLEASRRRR